MAEVAHPDDRDGPVLGEAERPGDLEGQRLDLVADSADAVRAQVAQVLAQLRRADAHGCRELLGRHGQDPLLGEAGEGSEVLREPRDGCVGDLATQGGVGRHAGSPAPLV